MAYERFNAASAPDLWAELFIAGHECIASDALTAELVRVTNGEGSLAPVRDIAFNALQEIEELRAALEEARKPRADMESVGPVPALLWSPGSKRGEYAN